MKRTLIVIGGFFVTLAAAVGLYFTFGLRAISLGCRGFSADCYIPAAQFSKDMQVLAVTMFLGTAVLLLPTYFFACSLGLLDGTSKNNLALPHGTAVVEPGQIFCPGSTCSSHCSEVLISDAVVDGNR